MLEHLNLREAFIFLAAAGLIIPLVKRFKLSPVLGFLAVGVAVGPYGLARFEAQLPWLGHLVIADVEGTRALAELGVVFLLFMIGLELSFERLWAMRRLVFGLGGTQVVATASIIALIAWAFGNSGAASLVLGGCLALSSTAIVMELLTEQGRFGTPVGHGCFSVLLAQDLAVVPILFLVGALGAGGDNLLVPLITSLGGAAVAVLAILASGKFIIRPLFRAVASARSSELFVAGALLIVIATAAATEAAGLSAPLGAFLAGLLFAESEFRHELEVNINPVKGLLLGLFFMTVGMGIDIVQILADPVWLLVSVLGLFAVKTGICASAARLFGYRWSRATEIGLTLAQGGEFAFVVIAMALTLNVLPEATAQFMLILVGLTMLMTPLTTRLAQGLGRWMAKREGASDPLGDGFETLAGREISGHVVIVGFGRTGQLVAQMLDEQRIEHVALDMDTARVAQQRQQGAGVYFGDARREALLERLGLSRASALVITMDDAPAAETVAAVAHKHAPHVTIVARAHDGSHAERLRDHGATEVVLEVLEAGLQLGASALVSAGVPRQAARALSDNRRELELGSAEAESS